ncbi:hypothetical protein G6F50_017131 [Rhizopus delemar]|uniref:Uncharacterized protein n=1 Tax=Rhizopus delemar TaxID=936053 RepID=A0A9P6XQZ0_9FUNG|nr:hypothetical protein G6F50_017131 [Rhizopus delemar]
MLERGDQATGHARHARYLHAVAVDADHALLRAGPDHALRIHADRADVASRHAIGGRIVVPQAAVRAEAVDAVTEGPGRWRCRPAAGGPGPRARCARSRH